MTICIQILSKIRGYPRVNLKWLKWRGNLIRTIEACELRFSDIKGKTDINVTKKQKVQSMKFSLMVK